MGPAQALTTAGFESSKGAAAGQLPSRPACPLAPPACPLAPPEAATPPTPPEPCVSPATPESTTSVEPAAASASVEPEDTSLAVEPSEAVPAGTGARLEQPRPAVAPQPRTATNPSAGPIRVAQETSPFMSRLSHFDPQ